MKRPFPFHHLLLALTPILFLYSHNAAKLPIAPSELLLPLTVSLAAALGLWLLFWLVMRNGRRAALVVSLFLALFFLYGRALAAIGSKTAPGLLPAIAAGILLLGFLVFGLPRKEFGGLTVFLNLVSLALVFINLITGIPAMLCTGARAPAGQALEAPAEPARPDIYYIILDGYARGDILNSVYGYDNSAFTGWLAQHGFRVARSSRSNYSQTYLSLASSLNMTYLDSVARRLGPESDNRSALLRMIADNRVMKELRQRGYTIASFASGYTGTDFTNADIHFAPRWALSEFQNVLISTTALPLLLDRLLRKSQFDLHRERILYAFQHLPDVVRLTHPVFVFCHILSPHPPFVFGAHGEKVNPQGYFTMTEGGSFQSVDKEKVRREYVEKYRAQLEFITGKTKTMVERILTTSPRPPLIILQADHGPGSVLNWDDPEPDQLTERMAILNAVLLPGDTDRLFYDSITPVNTFRILFDRLFKDTLSLLPDRSWFSTIIRPYRFFDVDAPQTYAAARNTGGAELSIVAFVIAEPTEPKNPALYARRLVTLKYPGESRSVANIYIRHVSARPGSTAVSGAVESYKESVRAGELPDLGVEYDSFQGKGPDGWPVTALFFPADR
ncbi:MAG: hypothetical protein NTX53_00290 [candidate division WOR-3 bacterium]|nr:hypothetical protein [candidate division WOR-3 bacterium]